MILWLFVLGLVAKVKSVRLNFKAKWLLCIALAFFCAMLTNENSRDRLEYEVLIQGILDSHSYPLGYEPLFVFTVWLVSLISSNLYFIFFALAFISVLMKFKLFNDYSFDPVSSVAVFVSYFFILHETTQIRIGLALAPLFLSFIYYYEGNKKKWLLSGVIAVFFHYSALLFLLSPILFPKKNYKFSIGVFCFSIVMVVMSVGLIPFLMLIESFFGFSKILSYIELLNSGVFSEINYLPRTCMVLLLLTGVFFGMKRARTIEEKAKLVLFSYLLYWSLFFFYAFSKIPVLAYRISDIFLFSMCFVVPFYSRFLKGVIFKRLPLFLVCFVNLLYMLIYLKYLVF